MMPTAAGPACSWLSPSPAPPQATVRVQGITDVCEQTGIAIYATIMRDGTPVVARLPRYPIPAANERIEVAFDPKDVHLFDRETEASLLGRSPATVVGTGAAMPAVPS